jgi:iron complex outermembrane receptor protein
MDRKHRRLKMKNFTWFKELPQMAVVSMFLLGSFAISGVQAQDADEEGEAMEEVIITGSRIRQDPLDQRLPVLTLTQEDFRATGVTSLADFVQRLPISGSAINGS